ncbi:interleukin-1 receptor accessory -like 1-A isoform X3 [Labeo rohita]|uniref:Interleukin-1 receptor accessory-like 1-A isoform X3 n=1 Tax=Labeo rohita TaxID=84645 RepID=A0A498NJQ2_LABRO|nr:interleukin-1 receptor accessory -like 1-A isoform X3 [Labeo rohita]RXN32081.1 interleukin-1 receptor accessory -like 1-A isoform X3 [Labeo rohita]
MVIYSDHCQAESSGSIIVFQGIAKLEKADSLFYMDVLLNDTITCQGLLDTGSMACTVNEETEHRLLDACGTLESDQPHADVLLVGCGGVRVKPKCIYQLKMCVYGYPVIVPNLVVPGQKDQLIVGTYVIKYILCQLKQSQSYWRVMNQPNSTGEPEIQRFLSMLSGHDRWEGGSIPRETVSVQSQSVSSSTDFWGGSPSDGRDALQKLGLSDLDIESCEVS